MSRSVERAPRVCILTAGHSTFDLRIFHKQAKSLVKAGYDVLLVAQHNRNEDVDGVRIVALPKPRNRFMRMSGGWRVFGLAFRQKADVYHFHEPELLPVGLLLRLLTKAKVIYDVHEDYPASILYKYWVPSLMRRPLSRVFDWVEKCLASRLDCVIVVNDDLSCRYQAKRVVTIWNYPILQGIEPKKQYGAEIPRLVYAGGLTEERGITELVQALEHLDSRRDLRLMLCGRFDPPSYEADVRRLKGFEKVEYMGWVRPEEMGSVMAAATIGMACLHPVPNYVYMPTTKVFEYMAAGLPVVASDFPAWRRFVEATDCGLTVDPLNPKEIARAVEYLVEHPDEARRMGLNGRNAVLDRYSWESESRKLLAVYGDLLEGVGTSQ